MRIIASKIRNSKGMTQPAVAELAGVRVATLSEIENGKGNPTIATLQKVADALQVDLLDLFESDSQECPEEVAMLTAFRSLGVEDQRLVLEMVARMTKT